ncbi:MAG TPA: sensor histidine kinase [Streptosporangiaceae bacterium]
MTADVGIGTEDALVDDPFAHPALFYSGEQEYVEGALPFVRQGLRAGDPVAVAVPGPNLEVLRAALGRYAAAVRMIDMRAAGRNPGRILPGVLADFADAHADARRVWIIGEPIWPGRTAREYPACVEHEALINLAFAGRSVSILCPYNVDDLDPAVVADARATHPVVRQAGREEASAAYDPGHIIHAYNRPFPDPDPDPASGTITILDFTADTVFQARRSAVERAARHALPPDRVGAVELVVNELAVNSVRHGGGSGTLRIWVEDDLFICEITDQGHIADPLAGRRPVGLNAEGKRGLLLANHASDLLRVHSTPAGTAIRAHFALPRTAG